MEPPRPDDDWRSGLRRRCESARAVLTAHPWALTLMDSRLHPGPALLRHHDALIGCLRRGGFSVALTARAFSLVDAHVFGFTLTEQSLPFEPTRPGAETMAADLAQTLAPYGHLSEFVSEITAAGDYTYSAEFDRGLAIILDQLAALRAAGESATET
ncbi:MAG: TetR/AcrR family transcriptional regulator C-terminal domain-containing protein [Gordonia sp. (in: high G+C Gram-positive bacteria)]|uniref:TetR/AcrR family transcriptional regulator C-terminal domain-containing protein n=1 Tax=Gordonia sp. (in: high G+C Gram-positive bacteria) TaxID=84139 RepID=UPI0039E35675